MAIIKSAYNFAPVEAKDEVFSPIWKDQVSFDAPLKDAYSGSITYQLKAETPLFVKGHDGHFTQMNGRYFIPATTLKGCFRSVLEIISYGHLGEKRVKDQTFPYRNLQDSKGYMAAMREVYCGWLGFDQNHHPIIRYFGKPHHISYKELSVRNRNIQNLTVVQKYNKLGYIYDKFTQPAKMQNSQQRNRPDNRLFCKFGGPLGGFVVFSGTISSKRSDFVLLEKEMNPSDTLQIDNKAWSSFQELYNEYEQIPNYTYNQFTGKLVFFTMEEENGQKKVKTLGLNYLHKYIAQKTIRTAIPDNLRNEKPDLADVMFGSEKYKLKGRVQFGHAFSQNAELLYKSGDSIITVLDSPKASFYPTYVQQGKTWDHSNALISGYKRYPIKPHFNIAAFNLDERDQNKYAMRFPSETEQLHQFLDSKENNYIPKNDNNEINFDTLSKLRPLKDGSIFTGRIVFFNLKKEELGALISSMTFIGHEEECKHSIGAGKAMGFGAMSISHIEIKKKEYPAPKGDATPEKAPDYSTTDAGKEQTMTVKALVDTFKEIMIKHNPNWENSARIKELIAMAKGFSKEELIEFITPMQLKTLLANGKIGNEFSQAKLQLHKGTAYFPHFSEIGKRDQSRPSDNHAANTRPAGFNRPSNLHANKNQTPRIQDLERQKGWILETEEEYNGIIKENQTIGINNPDDGRDYSRTIYCRYEIDEFCRNKPIPGDRVRISILEKEKNQLIINVLSINRRK